MASATNLGIGSMLENNKSLLDVRNAVFGYGQNIVIKSVSVSISEDRRPAFLAVMVPVKAPC